ncbi:MAG: DUF3794 domain-containing protein [Clostridia bacterium]|nr:DUF3794 domain-containing protein [Clostridia bacterium]
MEQKCLKTSVYFNDTVYSDSAEQAIDVDFTLPDYCPDISKIFKCRAVPRITSKGINGKTVTVDGNVAVTLIYADRDGNLCSYEYSYPFVKNLEMPNECAGANLCCRVRCEYINCRAVTGRKVDIHGAVGLYIKVFKRKCEEIISDFDDGNIELRRGIAPATVPMGYAEKYLLIEEEIRIGQGQPSVGNILRCDANTCVKETKVINDKAVVKGEMTVSLLYCPEGGGNPQCVKTVIPFSQIVDVEGITDTCMCDTKSEIAFFEAKPRISATGETKCISLTAKILLTCEGYCGNDIAVVLDAFSRKYQADIKRNKVSFEKITSNISEVYHCKKSVELEESITSVIDLWCNIKTATTKFENCNMIICGTLIAGMIVCNENDTAIYCEKPIDFEYKYPVSCELGIPHCEPQIEILSCGYTITSSNNIELRVELGINAAIYEKKDMSLISEMSLDNTRTVERRGRAAMTVYFPGADECVWDVARTYNASVEEIMSVNNLESESLCEGKMLLIPLM